MQDFTKRRRASLGRFLLRAGGFLFLLLVTFGTTRAAWGMYQKFSEAADLSAQAQDNLASLKAQEAQISAQVTALSSARGQEGELRQEYGVAKPGEGEIQIVRDNGSSTPSTAAQEGFFARILHAILPF